MVQNLGNDIAGIQILEKVVDMATFLEKRIKSD